MQKSQSPIAIFGGSFDPPHLAHIELIRNIPSFLSVEKVLIVPTRQSPLKEKASSWELRIKMLETALKSSDISIPFEISQIELEIPAPNTTVKLLDKLTRLGFNTKEHWFCMGQDCWEQFPNWVNWEEILSRINIAVFRRKDSKNENQIFPPATEKGFQKKLNALNPLKISFFDCDLPEVCSSEIRESIKTYDIQRLESLLPRSVFKMILSEHLYKD